MARKRSKQRKAERARRQRKELDGLIGRGWAEKVLAPGAVALPFTLSDRAIQLIHQLKK